MTNYQNSITKIKDAAALSQIVAKAKTKGKKIVFTNGCFDILHIGHIRYLKKAKALGDILVVGLNSDESVKRLKGLSRPVNDVSDRAEMLAELPFINYITIFGEETPAELIKTLKPDMLVKGGDWKARDIAGGRFVESHGGRVVTIPFVKGYSTTSLINRMKNK